MPETKRTSTKAESFTAEEKAAMRERARELKAQKGKADGEADLLAKIAEMPPDDRAIAERIHAIVKEVAPQLAPRTWYGSPAWALDGKVVVFFQDKAKFKARYATLGFNEDAKLDDGTMWPTSYALVELKPADEAKVRDLVKQAAG
jgi:uncharacterized protein YdhG (YjbR/CyaY superfamily)